MSTSCQVNRVVVFDIGMHGGEDTGFFLRKGYRVVGVDANPVMIERARSVYAAPIRDGQITLLNCAISTALGEVDVHISSKSAWTSLKRSIADRKQCFVQSVRVPSRTLTDMVRQYGVSRYIKIDIEGYDGIALASLRGSELPMFISAEAECADESTGKLTDLV